MRWQEVEHFFHGSGTPLEPGTILSAAKGAKFVRRRKLSIMETEMLLERFRPENCLSRPRSIFMCAKARDIALAGGLVDYIYEVAAQSSVERNHTGWWSLINTGGYWADRKPAELLQEYACNYWAGADCPNSSHAWEYRCAKAEVIRPL